MMGNHGSAAASASIFFVLLLDLLLPSITSGFQIQPSSLYSSKYYHNARQSQKAIITAVRVPPVNVAPTVPTDDTTTVEEEDQSNVKGSIDSLDNNDVFTLVAKRAAACLFESDMRRDAIGEKAGIQASSATNWINDATAFALQKAFDKLKLKLADERVGLDRDEASSWIRWMKSTPMPMIIDLSKEFHAAAAMGNNTLTSSKNLNLIDCASTDDFYSRIGCRLIVLPSGAALDDTLFEPPASVIYGKLLFGGISRYRLLVSSNSNRPPRRAGERTTVKTSVKENIPAWLQYGGPDRMYEAVDMGSAAVLEVYLLPRRREQRINVRNNMVLNRITWKPHQMFSFVDEDNNSDEDNNNNNQEDGMVDEYSGFTPGSLSGRDRNEAFRSDFSSSVGGLQPQIDAIVRRVLDGRVIRPAEDDGGTSGGDSTTEQLAMAAMEAEELSLLGLTPVRGLLLYGPPGCGKTALAREISRALRARAPKIVSAPELLDRWVGGSEKLVRALFADAESELAMHNGDASKSALHVVVIDEIDAVFRKRTSAEDSGEATRSSVVNQILAKLDGVKAAPNILLIGMTNRRELLDDALLRPGRLEVQIEIPLPDKNGRREILNIHFDALRKKGRLSKPLCCAIEGVNLNINNNIEMADNNESENYDNIEGPGRKRRAVKKAFSQVVDALPTIVRPTYDLAADYATGGFSGADIAGLVRCAGSIALARSRKDGNGIDGLLITLEDVKEALEEIKK